MSNYLYLILNMINMIVIIVQCTLHIKLIAKILLMPLAIGKIGKSRFGDVATQNMYCKT